MEKMFCLKACSASGTMHILFGGCLLTGSTLSAAKYSEANCNYQRIIKTNAIFLLLSDVFHPTFAPCRRIGKTSVANE